jgi:hypothetical protein
MEYFVAYVGADKENVLFKIIWFTVTLSGVAEQRCQITLFTYEEQGETQWFLTNAQNARFHRGFFAYPSR